MPVEIERQFLVRQLPELPATGEYLAQGYLTWEPEIRFRSVNRTAFFLTVKRGAGLTREELEMGIDAEEYENLKARQLPGTLLIEKRRYRLPLEDGSVAELFVHEGALAGFCYVEVEFPNEENARRFRPPSWFGREVTDDARFSYGTLASSDGADIVRALVQEEESGCV